jgi:hypothetical protein
MVVVVGCMPGLTDGEDDSGGDDTRDYSHPFLYLELSAGVPPRLSRLDLPSSGGTFARSGRMNGSIGASTPYV